MSARIPQKYASREAASRKLAQVLGYRIAEGCAFETYAAFADAIGLPADGNIPTSLRVRIEDYTAPPLEPEKETHFTHTHYSEETNDL